MIKYLLILFFSSLLIGCSSGRRPVSSIQNVTVDTLNIPSIGLQLLNSPPEPSLTIAHPQAAGNKYGFEGGTVVKVKDTYHLFTSEMYDDPFWVKMRLGYWVSKDKVSWQRVLTIVQSTAIFNGTDNRAAVWSPMVVFDSADNHWNLFYVAYAAAPDTKEQFRRNMNGMIVRCISQTIGIDGIGGPYREEGIVMKPGKEADAWEGLQGVDSFYPWNTEDGWYAFYGSAVTQKLPVERWMVGLAKSKFLSQKWKRLSSINPSAIEKKFIENPVVFPLKKGGWICLYDNDGVGTIGWSLSKNGINWTEGRSLFIKEKEEKNHWARDVRTPMSFIEEPDGTYTVFYTSYGYGSENIQTAKDGREKVCSIGYIRVKIQHL